MAREPNENESRPPLAALFFCPIPIPIPLHPTLFSYILPPSALAFRIHLGAAFPSLAPSAACKHTNSAPIARASRPFQLYQYALRLQFPSTRFLHQSTAPLFVHATRDKHPSRLPLLDLRLLFATFRCHCAFLVLISAATWTLSKQTSQNVLHSAYHDRQRPPRAASCSHPRLFRSNDQCDSCLHDNSALYNRHILQAQSPVR